MAVTGTIDIICPNPECNSVIGSKPINQSSGGKTTVCTNPGCGWHVKIKYTKDGYVAKRIK